MRTWGNNIRINGDWMMGSVDKTDISVISTDSIRNSYADEYESNTQDVLRKISQTVPGRSLLSAFDLYGTTNNVTIQPLNPLAVKKTMAIATIDADAKPSAVGNHGPGSDAIIWFHPMAWDNPYIMQAIDPGHHYRADDTLFHKCVHALRMIRGRWSQITMPVWEDTEELYACMLTNIYISSRYRNYDLRGSHQGTFFVLLTLTDEEFYNRYSDEIAKFRNEMSDLYTSFSLVQTAWNPLRVAERAWNATHPGIEDRYF